MNKKGFTLLEIIISTIIMALVMSGMASVFMLGKRRIVFSRSKIQGVELGSLFLDPLQSQVRWDTWVNPNNTLQTGTRYCDSDVTHIPQVPGCPSRADRTLDGIEYSAQYKVDRDTPINNINKVTVTISWDEPVQ